MARLRRIDGKKFITREECVKDFTLFKLAQGVSERTVAPTVNDKIDLEVLPIVLLKNVLLT